MKISRLTEKKMANKRFCKSENAIFITYCKFKDYPSAKLIAQKSKISRSTIYRHHGRPQNIPRDYEEYLLHLYQKKMGKILNKKGIDLKTLFLRTLIYIYSNRKTIKVLFSSGRSEIIKKILKTLKARILIVWNLTGDLDELYCIFENEIIGVIETWSKQGFRANFLDTTLNDIVQLTNTAPKRLAFLIKDKI